MKRKPTAIQCWPQGRTVKRATSVFLHSCCLAGGPNKNTIFWVEHTTAAFFFYFTAFAKVVKNGQILHQLDKNKVLWTPKLPVQTLPLSSIMLLHFFDILYVISVGKQPVLRSRQPFWRLRLRVYPLGSCYLAIKKSQMIY